MIVDAPFVTLPAFSVFDLNGHFEPLQRIFAFQPLGNCCVTCSVVSVNRVPLTSHLLTTPDVSVGNGSANPSQFSSRLLPLISTAPGPDRRVVVVAVLAGEEPVAVVVEPARVRQRRRRGGDVDPDRRRRAGDAAAGRHARDT